MNKIVLLSAIALSLASTAQASTLRPSLAAPASICAEPHSGVMRSGYFFAATDRAPASCCNGQLGCAQYLSTAPLPRPHRALRT